MSVLHTHRLRRRLCVLRYQLIDADCLNRLEQCPHSNACTRVHVFLYPLLSGNPPNERRYKLYAVCARRSVGGVECTSGAIQQETHAAAHILIAMIERIKM
jgi:hypothetical protein